MNDAEFLSSFEHCTLPFDQWDHHAHVRVAYLYAQNHDLDAALDVMRTGIKRYNKCTGTPESLLRGYHETITQAFMQLVYVACRQMPVDTSFQQFRQKRPELFTKNALKNYYSTERICTSTAKTRFVSPDLASLPRVMPGVKGGSITVCECLGDEHLLAARSLMQEFSQSLDFELSFQDFDKELADLPGKYQPPRGKLLLAFRRDQPAGCVALRPLGEAGDCEMKRLWVRPANRKLGLGRFLAEAILSEARRCGYARMRLDTIATMKSAIQLYRSLGFEECDPYTYNPIEGAVFMQFQLNE